MNQIIPFDFESHAVRCLWQGDQPWFVASDVCAILEITKPENAYGRLDEDERDTRTVGTPGGPQEMVVINESGLYALIFSSRKPEAKRFRKWVTAEVLPTLRRTGQFSMDKAKTARKGTYSAQQFETLYGQYVALYEKHFALQEKHIATLEERLSETKELLEREKASYKNSIYWRLTDALLDHTPLSDDEIASYISDVAEKEVPSEAIAFKRRQRALQRH